MKKNVRPFVVEYRSKRGRSRTARSAAAFRFAERPVDRMFAGPDMREDLVAWRSLFKQEARSP